MATEKKINSRIQQKHDVAANWAKAANFIPKKGEIIIYDAEYNASGEETQPVRFKIGDGSKTVNNLPFAVIDYGSDIETLEQEVADNSTAIGKIQGAFETNGTTVKKATSAGTADKVANGLTIADATFDGSKALEIGAASGHIEITGGSAANPNYVSIGLKLGNLMPSTYNKVTVDGYGIVTGGENVNYLTSHQGIKKLNTNNTTAQDANASEAIAGSGTINLHKVAKTGNYDDLLNKPTIPSIPTNYVTTDTTQDVDGVKSFYKTPIFKNGIQIGDGNELAGASDVSNITNYMPQKDGTLAVLGDIPTTYDELVRVKKQGYTGGDNTVKYFKLASFPVYNNGGNYASFIITGRMGGWQADNMSFVNMILYNRNGEGGGYINVANSAFFNLCDIVMYREEDGTSTAYLKVKSYYTFDINVNTYQATNVYTGTDDTPTGTLKWTASEQADRLAVSGGVAYVNGFTLPKQVEINGETVNPNSAGLINLGTGFAKAADLPIKSATLTGTTLYLTL
jgi:hypothetical protein